MDRRRTPRFPSKVIAQFRILGDHPLRFAGEIAETSEGGMRVFTPTPLEPDQCIEITAGEIILFGEVCYRCPSPPEAPYPHMAGIVIREYLSGLDSLRHLITAL